MNAISLLKQDHGNIENLFHRFETLESTDLEQKARVRDKIVEHLSVHAAIEEQYFYPAVRGKLESDEFAVLEGLEEHHVAKWTLSELERMEPSHERFDPKMTVLIESVRHHVKEEEEELFPKVREAFTVEELNDLGEKMEKGKATAPTRPHPRTPDTPPLNIVLGAGAAVFDKALQTGREAVGKLMRLRV
jgi:hemerythrin superfamily protein